MSAGVVRAVDRFRSSSIDARLTLVILALLVKTVKQIQKSKIGFLN